jgi:hypothetical protein
MVSATDRENLALTYSIQTPPTLGTATINANTGAIAYTVAGFETATSDTFTVNVAMRVWKPSGTGAIRC